MAFDVEPYTFDDIFYLLGVTPTGKGADVRIPCPICGKGKLDKNMVVHRDTGFFTCFSNPEEHHGKYPQGLYAKVYGLSGSEAHQQIMSQLGRNPKDYYEHRTRKIVPPVYVDKQEELPVADLVDRDKTYRNFLGLLSLSDKHREALKDRGLTNQEIEELLYKTQPAVDDNPYYFDITKKLIEKDCKFDGVAGFYRSKSKNYPMINHQVEGITVPYVSFDGKIQCYQIRVDDDRLKPGDNKYFWQTSAKNRLGSRPDGLVHYAVDFETKDGKTCPKIYSGKNDKYICITEGAMKADIAHAISGKPFVAIPGVGIINALVADLPKIKALGVTKIMMFFDTDQICNINVLIALEKLSGILREAGFEVENGTRWDLQNFNLSSDFVFTPKTLKEAIEDDRLDWIMDKLLELGRTRVWFAYPEEFKKEYVNMYHTLGEKAKEKKFSGGHCKWSITRKGVDDFLASTMRNISFEK